MKRADYSEWTKDDRETQTQRVLALPRDKPLYLHFGYKDQYCNFAQGQRFVKVANSDQAHEVIVYHEGQNYSIKAFLFRTFEDEIDMVREEL